jgi:imidazolonepropionase
MISCNWEVLFTGFNLATMTDSGSSYGEIKDGALAIGEGKILWIGSKDSLPVYDKSKVDIIEGHGQWITPGLIDCHTHIIYASNRSNEFEMRLQGKSYQEIAENGGGIVSTVQATRKATEAELYQSALKRLNALESEGVTTIEIKSGYGLDLENEVKMLKVAEKLQQNSVASVHKTFLGAHTVPKDYKDSPDEYINIVCDEMIPYIAKLKLANAVDVFCENIGFTIEQTERVFKAATKHNLKVKVHAEQLSNIGGTALAAKYKALSSDHIEYLDSAGVVAMAQAKMVAVLLPGPFYFIRETKLPPVDLLRKHNVPIAIATDSNPGTSPLNSILLMLNMACTLFKLTPNEALAGITCNAARALGAHNSIGQLMEGMDADIAIWDIEHPAELAYQFGVNPLKAVYKQGKKS